MAKRKLTQLAYDALTVEGGLFNAEWLAKVAHLQAPSQKLEDYEIPAGLNLRDEIARAWRIGQALWIKFRPSILSETNGVRVATEKFVTGMLEQAFGFSELTKQSAARLIGASSFPISHCMGHVPLLIAACNEDLDEGQARFGEMNRRRSPFGLMQEYLNASDESLWGLVSNGLSIRLLRDNVSLTRPAWMEVDLQRIFAEERFADFSALWLTIHASRFGRTGRAPSECALELWRLAGQQAGTRAREELSGGVRRALLELGQGFVSDPLNSKLRDALVDGSLSAQAYFQQLLRLVYRVIFLLTVEERGLLHPSGSNSSTENLYARGYSLRRLRERAVRHSAHDTHRDLYSSLKVSFRCLASGDVRLALPALGGLFGAEQTPLLDVAELQNRRLLSAVWSLAWIARDGATERVNWHDMGPEELGSVYESLLELVPQIGEGASSFKFADGDETRGNARKLSGSYYTPDSLVQSLLDSALEPVIAQKRAERAGDEAAAILSITVIDPAVGSGHFLLAAARRLATHLARVRAQGQPSAIEHRRAVRDVVSHCLFGVDRNPMALELAKIALWLESMTPDAPLSFLDAHLVLGDALLGILNPIGLAQGIPDDAYKQLTGDDEESCKRLRVRNRDARKMLEKLSGNSGQQLLGFVTQTTAAALAELDALPDDTLDAVEAKRSAYELIRSKQDEAGLGEDLLLAAYLMPKRPETEALVPTSEHLLRALTNQPLDVELVTAVRREARKHHVFHWRDAFAQIFARGGFDCTVGNPPWERIKLQEQEFFASRAPDVANARNKSERARAIKRLEQAPAGSPERRMFDGFQEAKRASEASSAFAHDGVRFPLTGIGDVNTYALFAETVFGVISRRGRAGIVVPSGIATDDSTKMFFQELTKTKRLVELFGFDNEKRIFPAVHPDTPFSLLTLGEDASAATFVHYALEIDHIKDSRRRFLLSADELAVINPNTRTCPVFRSHADAELSKRIYSRIPVLWDESRAEPNPWSFDYMTKMFDMADSSHEFVDLNTLQGAAEMRTSFVRATENGERLLPLIEAKHIGLFDHRWASGLEATSVTDHQKESPKFSVETRYWVSESRVKERLATKQWSRSWLMGWRDVTNATNERTAIVAVFPATAVAHTLRVLFVDKPPSLAAAFLGCLSSLVFDFNARQKVGGTHLTVECLKQLPVLTPNVFSREVLAFVVPRVLELTYTAFDLKSFYDDLVTEDPSYDTRPAAKNGEPFDWNPERRCIVRAELDAYFARLYGLTRDDLRYILDPADVVGVNYPSETFRVLKDREIRLHGEYRTQRLVLEAWDALHQQKQEAATIAPPIRRTTPTPPYLPTSVPSCEEEGWLAGLACDVIIYAGPMSEPNLRLVLSTTLDTESNHYGVELDQWVSTERLDRLPQVLRWLRQLIGIPANRDLNISANQDLQYVPGDIRTEQLARALVDSYRAEQASANAQPLDRASDGDAALSSVRPKRA